MRRQAQGCHFASFEEVADILHLNERHRALLELDRSTLRLGREVRELAQDDAILEVFQEVACRKLYVECRLDPTPSFVRGLWCVARQS